MVGNVEQEQIRAALQEAAAGFGCKQSVTIESKPARAEGGGIAEETRYVVKLGKYSDESLRDCYRLFESLQRAELAEGIANDRKVVADILKGVEGGEAERLTPRLCGNIRVVRDVDDSVGLMIVFPEKESGEIIKRLQKVRDSAQVEKPSEILAEAASFEIRAAYNDSAKIQDWLSKEAERLCPGGGASFWVNMSVGGIANQVGIAVDNVYACSEQFAAIKSRLQEVQDKIESGKEVEIGQWGKNGGKVFIQGDHRLLLKAMKEVDPAFFELDKKSSVTSLFR